MTDYIKKKRRKKYKGNVARVPISFVHSMGHIWATQKVRITDFRPKPWRSGNSFYSLYEPVSLSPWDLQNYLMVLHVLQNPKIYTLKKDEYGFDRYRILFQMKDIYNLLNIPYKGSGRGDLKESIINHCGTVLRVIRPDEDIIYWGLGLNAGTVKFEGIGRSGLTCELTPYKALIDNKNKLFSENITRMLKYRFGMSKLIDFYVLGKLNAGVSLTEKGWMSSLSRGDRLDIFQKSFYPALQELADVSFNVKRDEAGNITVKYVNRE